MISKGIFGYVVGRKKRFMKVETNANLLWRILVREIYVIMIHFDSSKELLQKAFEKIKVIKNTVILKPSIIKKCKMFTDLEEKDDPDNANNILKYCQGSFINLLESGHICIIDENENMSITDNYEYKFIFDFNKWEAYFYKNKKLINLATLTEIMEFDEMPKKTFFEIVSEMKTEFNIYYEKVSKLNQELEKIDKLKIDAINQNDINIEEKLNKMIDDLKWNLKELHINRSVFYQRLKALDLINCE
jgi:hypothetical protein